MSEVVCRPFCFPPSRTSENQATEEIEPTISGLDLSHCCPWVVQFSSVNQVIACHKDVEKQENLNI